MPHQCVKCNNIFQDGSNELLKVCSKCGGKFFFYLRKDSVTEQQKIIKKLSVEDKKKIEEDVMDILGNKEDIPVVLDLASINIIEPGKFELDLVKLFKGDPLVYKLDEGKYVIDVAETFKNSKRKIKP